VGWEKTAPETFEKKLSSEKIPQLKKILLTNELTQNVAI
jgi:hypothetical protein